MNFKILFSSYLSLERQDGYSWPGGPKSPQKNLKHDALPDIAPLVLYSTVTVILNIFSQVAENLEQNNKTRVTGKGLYIKLTI